MRPPRPVDWEAAGAAGAAKDWQMGNASAEEAVMAADGSAEDCPGAPRATTHGPAAEVLYEGAECDVTMTKKKRKHWYSRGGKWRWV